MTNLNLKVGDMVKLRNGDTVGPLVLYSSLRPDLGFTTESRRYKGYTPMWAESGQNEFFFTYIRPELDIVSVVKTEPTPEAQLSNQQRMVLKHLKKTKGLTVREAMVEYSISSLTKRIQELRGHGYDIVSHSKKHPVTGQRYVRYTLEAQKNEG